MRHPTRSGLLALAAVIGLAALASDTRESVWPKSTTGRLTRLLLIGDSLAIGLNAPLRTEMGYGWDWAPTHARSGSTLLGWDDAPAIVRAERPDVVIVSLGTNDAASKNAEYRTRFAERAAELVRRLHFEGVRVVWLIPPEMPFPTEDIVAAIVNSGARYLYPPTNLERSPDRIHPTARGYAVWAKRIAGS